LVRKIIATLIFVSLVLSSLGSLVPTVNAWKVISYQTCRDYDSNTGACIDPTSNFKTLDTLVWLHAEFDLSDIPSSVKFNTITEWRDPTGHLYQRVNYTWSGGSSHLWSNRGMYIAGTNAANLPGNWTVSFILDGEQIGHNLLAFTTSFVIAYCFYCLQQTTSTTSSDVDSKGYVIGADLHAPYTSSPPDVSTGILKFEQWKDASIAKMLSAPNALAYLLLQHDDKGLYIGIDVPTQKKIDVVGNVVGNCCQDVVYLIFDTKHIGFDGSTYAANPHIRYIGGQIYFVNVAYDQYVQSINKYSYSRTPLDNVILGASINPSPIISGDTSHGYRMTAEYASDGNLMWTAFVPNEVLKYNASTPLLDKIGCRVGLSVSDSPYHPAFEYPRDYHVVNKIIVDTVMPIAGLTFLPEQTTTTTSSRTSIRPVTSTATTLPSTSTLTTASTTRRDVISENSSLILAGALAMVICAIGAVVAYRQLRKKKKAN
jgi:hypothetical protein